ncbi:hypothetical protein BDF19DRAFT_447214 [Syncephalis fuscata]|nr:hypothetical protein BDF19DRAFT_447214 [Syncephalis fuscata]
MSMPVWKTDYSKIAAGKQKQLAAYKTNQVTVLTELQSALICHICLDQLRDPRTLPCQHTFCAECIQQLIAATAESRLQDNSLICNMISIGCPLKCRQHFTTTIDDEAARRLPINYVIARVLETTEQLRVCEVDGNIPQTHYCLTHNKFHCVDCKVEWNCRVVPTCEANTEMLTSIRQGKQQVKDMAIGVEQWIDNHQYDHQRLNNTRMAINQAFDELEKCLQERRCELLQQLETNIRIHPKDITQKLYEKHEMANELEMMVAAGKLSAEISLERGQQILETWNSLMPPLEAWYNYVQSNEAIPSSHPTSLEQALNIRPMLESIKHLGTLLFNTQVNTNSSQLKQQQNKYLISASTKQYINVRMLEAGANPDNTITLALLVSTLVADLAMYMSHKTGGPERSLRLWLRGKTLPVYWTLFNCCLTDQDIIIYDYIDRPVNKKQRFV